MLLNLFTGISEWTPENVLPVAGCLSLVALGGEILSVSCAVLLDRRLVERLAKQQYQMLGKHMETSKEQYLQLVKIRHDIKNHGLCLAQLLADGKTEEARRYLEQMNLRMEQSEAVIQTGSVFADALLNPKCRRAKAMGIDRQGGYGLCRRCIRITGYLKSVTVYMRRYMYKAKGSCLLNVGLPAGLAFKTSGRLLSGTAACLTIKSGSRLT